jgi:hypothetical protein
MRGNWNGALTEVWESSLDLAASFAEGYARLSRRGCNGCRQPGFRHCYATSQPLCRGEGDFLADWIHLNLTHVSQVARLSAAYSGVAVRALERFYSCFDPCDPTPSGYGSGGYELCLVGRGVAYGMLTVRNTLGTDAIFQIDGNAHGVVTTDLKPLGAPSVPWSAQLELTVDDAPFSILTLKAGEVGNVVVKLDATGYAKGKYRGTILGLLGSGGRSVIHVVVDLL